MNLDLYLCRWEDYYTAYYIGTGTYNLPTPHPIPSHPTLSIILQKHTRTHTQTSPIHHPLLINKPPIPRLMQKRNPSCAFLPAFFFSFLFFSYLPSWILGRGGGVVDGSYLSLSRSRSLDFHNTILGVLLSIGDMGCI